MGLVFPKKCVLCGAALPLCGTANTMLCPDCAQALYRDYRCTNGVFISGLDGATAALYYRGPVAAAMKRFKFNHFQQYAPWFAAQASIALTAELDDWQPDLLTYIPIGPFRRYQRGYNQSELLAREIARSVSISCEQLLFKKLFSRKQSAQKDRAAREENVKNAFAPMRGADIRGKSVVVVDDIITTGATLRAASAVLREMGAARVYAVAPVRTKRK